LLLIINVDYLGFEQLHDRISRGMVHISIDGGENMAGLITGPSRDSIYTIADARCVL
jgi:hypothetical protein